MGDVSLMTNSAYVVEPNLKSVLNTTPPNEPLVKCCSVYSDDLQRPSQSPGHQRHGECGGWPVVP